MWFVARQESLLVLASLTDSLPQILLVGLVMGGCLVGVVLWLAKRHWEPTMRRLTTMVEHEMQRAERSAQALQAGMQAQNQRAQRQAASVHGAIAGVRALHNITEELDQCASDLKHLAHLMSAESPSRRIADHVVTSAKQIALTAEQAHQTYHRLQSSVNQLVAEATSIQDFGEEAEQHARELTGMMDRVRQGMRTRRPVAPAAPMKLPDGERRRREEPPPRREEPPPRREEPSSRRNTRREAPREPDWSEADLPIMREPRRESRHDYERPSEDLMPRQHRSSESMMPDPRPGERITRRRDEGEPRRTLRDDHRYRRVDPVENGSGWLSDQGQAIPRHDPRRPAPDDDRRRRA